MSYTNFARPIGPDQSTIQDAPEKRSGVAPHRGDVTTVQAATYVRLQGAKRKEKPQAHALSHRTGSTVSTLVQNPKIDQA